MCGSKRVNSISRERMEERKGTKRGGGYVLPGSVHEILDKRGCRKKTKKIKQLKNKNKF